MFRRVPQTPTAYTFGRDATPPDYFDHDFFGLLFSGAQQKKINNHGIIPLHDGGVGI